MNVNDRVLFCNIGWMARYKGLVDQPDKIVGGGKFVEEEKYGYEVCNFLSCRDGKVYGYVETGGDNITIEKIGAGRGDDFVDNVTVVWTATHPDEGGRYVVGWYENARVYRKNMEFTTLPSKQHKKDLKSYRIVADITDVALLSIDQRGLPLGHGAGWMGQDSCWYPQDHAKKHKNVKSFLDELSELIKVTDVSENLENTGVKAGDREAIIRARIGQGPFRSRLLREWKKCCSVTGCKVPELLRASHIKPWREADNHERIDRQNGLLLVAGIDAAFDKGLVSFLDDGKIIVSPRLTSKDMTLLGISKKQRLSSPPEKGRRKYLEYHRDRIFLQD